MLKNAISYSYENTTITINMIENEENIEITFKNKGATIPEYKLERIFDKFYSGEHKIADNRRSLGLGLYLCKAIVEAHGGSIHVTDNLPHGSVFRFTLPLEEVIIHEEISNPRCGG